MAILLGGLFRVVCPDEYTVTGDIAPHACNNPAALVDGQIPATKKDKPHTVFFCDGLCAGGSSGIAAGHQADAIAGTAAPDAEGGGGYFPSIRERSCPCICGSALDVPALILSCSAFQFLYRDAGMRTVTPFAAVAYISAIFFRSSSVKYLLANSTTSFPGK